MCFCSCCDCMCLIIILLSSLAASTQSRQYLSLMSSACAILMPKFHGSKLTSISFSFSSALSLASWSVSGQRLHNLCHGLLLRCGLIATLTLLGTHQAPLCYTWPSIGLRDPLSVHSTLCRPSFGPHSPPSVHVALHWSTQPSIGSCGPLSVYATFCRPSVGPRNPPLVHTALHWFIQPSNGPCNFLSSLCLSTQPSIGPQPSIGSFGPLMVHATFCRPSVCPHGLHWSTALHWFIWPSNGPCNFLSSLCLSTRPSIGPQPSIGLFGPLTVHATFCRPSVCPHSPPLVHAAF